MRKVKFAYRQVVAVIKYGNNFCGTQKLHCTIGATSLNKGIKRKKVAKIKLFHFFAKKLKILRSNA
jgi:hypothetical protein